MRDSIGCDVVVIGGGPSGLNLARLLARKGMRVSVLERKKDVGEHIICTGIVGQRAFQEFDLLRGSIRTEIRKIKLVSPFANSLTYEHPTPLAYAVDRGRFDRYLGRSAESEGAEVRLESEATDIRVNKDAVDVEALIKGRERVLYRARVAVLATGINYQLHRNLGLGQPGDLLYGVQAELKAENVGCTQVFLGRKVAAGAFAWLVPLENDLVRIGLITERDPEECFHRLIQNHLPEKTSSLEKSRIQLKAIAQGVIPKTYGERILVVGEAAGQVKTTTGGGIYFGLLCSEIAAEVLMKAFDRSRFSGPALAEYEKSWKAAIQKEIQVGYRARKIYAKLSDRQLERLFQAAINDGVIPLIREKGNFDWHSELILTLMRKLAFRPFFNRQTGHRPLRQIK